jgi:hypothetical protein
MDAATALAEFAPVGTLPVAPPEPRWSLATKVAFRFFSIYFGLYVLTTQMLGGFIPFLPVPPLSYQGPVRWMVEWTALHVFDITTPLVVTGSGSGDKTFDWLQAFCLLVIAAVLTIAWSLWARAGHHVTAHKWYRLFLRFALGTTMLSYGMAKVFPLQMPFPNLARLLEPYGHFSPMGVLWASIGASPSYEMLTGWVEVSAAILLFVPHTAILGAIVALFASVQIFSLNMTYDVPVKLFSFHLILMSVFLLAPELKRLLNVIVLNRVAEPSTVPAPGSTPRARRILIAVQIVFALVVIGEAVNGSLTARSAYGYLAPRSPLYGIWDVKYMSIDGVERAPRVDDYDRWRRLTFDFPQNAGFHRMDDTVARYGVKLDETAKSMALTLPADPKWSGTLSYERPDPTGVRLRVPAGVSRPDERAAGRQCAPRSCEC